MKKNISRIILVFLLITCMVLEIPLPVYGTDTIISSGDYTINTDGEYMLSSNYSGKITIANNVTDVTVKGYSSDIAYTNTYIVMDSGRTSAINLTIENLNITAPPDENGIDFVNSGTYDNKLYISGDCRIVVIDNQFIYETKYRSGIHVPDGIELTIDKENGLLDANAKLEVFGGYLSAGIGGGNEESVGTINIVGGTINSTGGTYGAGIGSGHKGTGGTINLSGGTITSTGGYYGAGIGGGYLGNGGTINISGGTITSTGGKRGAGIGGGYLGNGGTINISGGTINSTSVHTGAGIGGGSDGESGTINISGGTIDSTSGHAGAGIGGGYSGTVGIINISGGTINSTGVDYGAGIGGGYLGNGGTINISGGTINSTNGKYGAGIGGGYSGNGGTINISGGAINSTGGIHGAGIGGGSNGAGGTINISGGTINSTGVGNGAGIGGGLHGNGGNISISGGNITSNGGNYGSGIGGGSYGNGGTVTIENNPTVIAVSDYHCESIGSGFSGTNNGILKNSSGDSISYVKTKIEDNMNNGIANASITINNNDEATYLTNENGLTGFFTKINIPYDYELHAIGYNAQTGTETPTSINYERTYTLIDTTPPAGYSISIDQDQIDISNEYILSFSFTGAEIGATCNYEINSNNGGTSVTGSEIIQNETGTISNIDVSELNDGILTLNATFTDKYGNKGNIVIDTVIIDHKDNADLYSLIITGETLDKTFNPDVLAYKVESSNNLDSIEITAKAVDFLSTININNEISTGTTTKTVSLNNGQNFIPIVVTSEDGTKEKTYILSVNGTVSNADLLNLKVNDSSVSGFDKDTLNYVKYVNNDVESIEISASLSDENALMLINNSIYQGGNKTINLEVGENNIEIIAVAQDSTTKTYTLSINRGTDTGKATIETVDSDGEVGRYTSLAIDSDGNPHISYCYYDNSNGDLKYTYKDKDGWHISTVDSNEDESRYISLAIDSNGNPHISYCDLTNGDLKYAYKDNDGWHVSAVDSNGIVGGFTSIAIDSNGNPHISHFDASNEDLKYAYKDNDGWRVSTVDSNGYIGQYTSLEIDSNGNPHISYHDASNTDLKYAYKDNDGWHISTVDSNGYIGEYTSLEIDSNGNPHISYYDCTNKNLKYAYKDETGWHISTIDSNGDVGWCTSLEIDSNGNPHISYSDYTNYDLKYAYKDDTVWHISTVDSDGEVGFYTSLEIDSNDNPHISYYDNTNRDLKYVSIYPNININTDINIGIIKEGKIHEETLEITNDGYVDLNIANIVSSSQNLAIEDIVGETIYPGETKEFQVFISTTEIGIYNETLEIHSNDPDGVFVVDINGQVTYSESNTDLKSLSITGETLDKEFDPDISVYEIANSNNLDNIEITAETMNPLSTININDEISIGTTVKTVTLINGENLKPIVVTSQDGTTEKAYILSVNGTVSDADLLNLKVDKVSVSGFDKDTESYTLNVNNDVENIDISATPSDDNALILINNAIYQGGNKTIDLEVAENLIEVMVVAQDSTTKTYTLAVNRGTANANLSEITLSSGTLNEAFDPFIYSYTATVNNSIDSITIMPTTEDSNATVKVNGKDISTPVDLQVGENTVTIEVTGADGVSKKTYELIITRREALEIINTSLPIGIAGGSYNTELNAEGGKAPYEWSATGLPDGLNINTTTGKITGSPTTEGKYTVNIKVVDATGIESIKTLSIKINLGCGNGGYIITPKTDSAYTSDFTDDAIPILTINEGVTGFKYLSITVSPVNDHIGNEMAIFTHYRNGLQIGFSTVGSDFYEEKIVGAGFNVQAGDIIKIYIVDEISNDIGHSPSIL